MCMLDPGGGGGASTVLWSMDLHLGARTRSHRDSTQLRTIAAPMACGHGLDKSSSGFEYKRVWISIRMGIPSGCDPTCSRHALCSEIESATWIFTPRLPLPKVACMQGSSSAPRYPWPPPQPPPMRGPIHGSPSLGVSLRPALCASIRSRSLALYRCQPLRSLTTPPKDDPEKRPRSQALGEPRAPTGTRVLGLAR